jgi:hypothetical protein
LMSAALLYAFLLPVQEPITSNPSATTYESVVNYFVRSLTNELSSLQKVAIAAVNYVLRFHILAQKSYTTSEIVDLNPASTTTTSDAVKQCAYPTITRIENESEWLSYQFHDYMYAGSVYGSKQLVSFYTKPGAALNSNTTAIYKKGFSSTPIFDHSRHSEFTSESLECFLLSSNVLSSIETILNSSFKSIVNALI